MFQTYPINLGTPETLRIKPCANKKFVLILQLVYCIMHKTSIQFYFFEFFSNSYPSAFTNS